MMLATVLMIVAAVAIVLAVALDALDRAYPKTDTESGCKAVAHGVRSGGETPVCQLPFGHRGAHRWTSLKGNGNATWSP